MPVVRRLRNRGLYRCPYSKCQWEEFATLTSLNTHIKRLHPEEPVTYGCLYCAKRLLSLYSMVLHVQAHYKNTKVQAHYENTKETRHLRQCLSDYHDIEKTINDAGYKAKEEAKRGLNMSHHLIHIQSAHTIDDILEYLRLVSQKQIQHVYRLPFSRTEKTILYPSEEIWYLAVCHCKLDDSFSKTKKKVLELLQTPIKDIDTTVEAEIRKEKEIQQAAFRHQFLSGSTKAI